MPGDLSLDLYSPPRGPRTKMDQDKCVLDLFILESFRGFIGKSFSLNLERRRNFVFVFQGGWRGGGGGERLM